jgi:hypothetical protein
MSSGPFLYDDGPEALHTGTPRRRPFLLVAIFGGTAILAVLMVLALPLIKGSPGDQAKEAVGVFLAALQKGDTTTAYQLMCAKEQARLKAADVPGAYADSATGTVTGVSDDPDGTTQQVAVRWSDGSTTRIAVVPEDGAHVCGTSRAG